MQLTTIGQVEKKSANMLGLDYREEAARLPYRGPIYDVHTHINTLESARLFFEVADLFGIDRVWSMTQLEQVDQIKAAFGDRIEFIAVPNFPKRDDPKTFTENWHKRIVAFAKKGVKVCKFWAAPRGLDFIPDAWLDSPTRQLAMEIAVDHGMMLMTHIGDPDTWFATKYADAKKYGTKPEHHASLERVLDRFSQVNWLAAHMAGTPEDLSVLQGLLDRHENLYIDTSATKWMVRELSKHPGAFADFCRANPGRVLFGSDIVTNDDNIDFDLYASRYWALRTLMETDYDGPSPIVDPDLHMVDQSLPQDSTAELRGAAMDQTTLDILYRGAAEGLHGKLYQ